MTESICAYCGNETVRPYDPDEEMGCPARGGAACVERFEHDDLNANQSLGLDAEGEPTTKPDFLRDHFVIIPVTIPTRRRT